MDKWFCAIFVNCLSYLVGVCDVWGGQHHLTFDGKTYNFTKNCTYYLVKEIITKYNLTITVNHVCDSSDSIPCPQIFTVIYGSTTVVFKELESSPTVRNYSNFSNMTASQQFSQIFKAHRCGVTQCCARLSFFNMFSDLALQVFLNEKRIYPAYSNSILRLTSTDMAIMLEIPAIKAKIVYKGDFFSIDLPYSLFSENTEGQCGELPHS